MTHLVPTQLKTGIETLRENISEAFDRFLSKLRHEEGSNGLSTWSPVWSSVGLPPIDVEEDEDTIRVTAELPGLEEKDFKVEISNNRLVIRGEKQGHREEKKKNYYYAECRYGSFMRTVPLPCEVDTDHAEANYKHGVLKITLPKTEAAKAKRIRVKAA